MKHIVHISICKHLPNRDLRFYLVPLNYMLFRNRYIKAAADWKAFQLPFLKRSSNHLSLNGSCTFQFKCASLRQRKRKVIESRLNVKMVIFSTSLFRVRAETFFFFSHYTMLFYFLYKAKQTKYLSENHIKIFWKRLPRPAF